jgi:hypothetical protein
MISRMPDPVESRLNRCATEPGTHGLAEKHFLEIYGTLNLQHRTWKQIKEQKK